MLHFVYDLVVALTNNPAERVICVVKLLIKISGGLRSERGNLPRFATRLLPYASKVATASRPCGEIQPPCGPGWIPNQQPEPATAA